MNKKLWNHWKFAFLILTVIKGIIGSSEQIRDFNPGG